MKKILTATLPALALLALGGCAPTGAISSTEDDGVYYSSADRTTVAAPAARPQADGYGYETARVQTQTTQTTEDANPDYQGGGTQGTSTDYYDESYTSASPSGFGQPYTGPGVSTYNYTPNWSVSPSFYGSPFGYGMSIGYGYGGLGGFGGYSPFGYGLGYPGYAGFYDPFFSPWGYGYGSAFSLGFGYGFGGLGGFGYPYGFGRPYGYSPYAYGGGYYGGADYYGGGYGGARRYVYKSDIVNGAYPNGYDRGAVRVGRREGRSMNAVGSPGVVNPGGAAAPGGVIGGRRLTNGAAGGFGNAVGGTPGQLTGSNPNSPNAPGGQPTGGRRFDQTTLNPNSPAAGGWRTTNNGTANGAYNQPGPGGAANPGAAPARRGGFFRDVFGASSNGGGQSPNGSYAQPQRRVYSSPDQGFPQQRSYSQPQPQQRSYSQPAPSFGGGGGGAAGGFGGGGGGGGGRRGR